MNKILPLILIMVVVIGMIFYIWQQTVSIVPALETNDNNDSQNVGLANPASEFCIQSGGRLEIITSGAGESANCIFPSGEVCEEWALFRGECMVGGVSTPGSITITETFEGRNQAGQTVVFEHQEFTSYTLRTGDVVSNGLLNTERGWQADIDATVFVLNWKDVEDDQVIFVKKTGSSSLMQLNPDRTVMAQPLTLTITN